MAQPGTQGNHQLERAGDAQDHADPVAVEIAIGRRSRRRQGLAGDQQAQELGGVGRLDGMGRDAEVEQRKFDRREKAAPVGVGPVGGLGVAVEVVVGPPVSGRDLGDRVEPVADIGPEPRQVLRLGNMQPIPMMATGTGGEKSDGFKSFPFRTSLRAGGDAMVLGTSTVRARLTMVRSLRPVLNLAAIQGSQSRHARRQGHSLGR